MKPSGIRLQFVSTKQIPCIKMLKALADETWWRLVQRLLEEPATVNELTDKLGVTQYNASKHLRILEEAGIVQKEKEGKNVRCCIVPEFKHRIARDKTGLNLGCCSFKFDER